jgi:hypothetical protein
MWSFLAIWANIMSGYKDTVIYKAKVYPTTCTKREKRYSYTLSFTLALSSGGWLIPISSRFTPGNDPVPNC